MVEKNCNEEKLLEHVGDFFRLLKIWLISFFRASGVCGVAAVVITTKPVG
jgi:hypothetical protein